MTETVADSLGPAKAMALAQAWDMQTRQIPLLWHPDWLHPAGWPAHSQPTRPTQLWPAWLRQRLQPALSSRSLGHPHLRPALEPLQAAVCMLSSLALHLRPDVRRRQLRRLNLAETCMDNFGGAFTLSEDASGMGLLEWAAIGVQDWGRRLAPEERAAYRLLRRLWPRSASRLLLRFPAAVHVETPLDWNSLWLEQEADDA